MSGPFKVPPCFIQKPWRHIPKALQKYYTKNVYRQRYGLFVCSVGITFSMAVTLPAYGWTEEEKDFLRDAIRRNGARFYLASLLFVGSQTLFTEFLLRRVLFRGMIYTSKSFYPSTLATCFAGCSYSLLIMPNLTPQQLSAEIGRCFVDGALMCSCYLLSGSFWFTVATAMACSGINYTIMLAEMFQGEDPVFMDERIEMVTGGDFKEEHKLDYLVGSQANLPTSVDTRKAKM